MERPKDCAVPNAHDRLRQRLRPSGCNFKRRCGPLDGFVRNSDLLWTFPSGASGEDISLWVETNLMTMRKPVLCSAACLLLCCTTIAATRILAQQVATTSAQAQDDLDFADRLLMPNVPVTLMRLEDVADVNDDLFNMPVIDAAGYPVGHFRRVETKVPGDVVAVITLNGSRRTIAVLTEHVRYEPAGRLIIADLTTFELDRTPSEFPSG
jgi:hypothetical protein